MFNDSDDVDDAIDDLKNRVTNSMSNRLSFYRTINNDLRVHDIYIKDTRVNEIERVSWTRLPLSAHSLAIEKGLWNHRGRGRLPR